MNRLDFEGRVAVVTGGATGIGLAVAQRLKASGGRVSLWDRDPSALDRAAATLGQGTDIRSVDVADADGVAAAAQATAAALGRIDALVCSAGHHRPEHDDLGVPGRRLAPGDRRQPERRLPLQPRGRAR